MRTIHVIVMHFMGKSKIFVIWLIAMIFLAPDLSARMQVTGLRTEYLKSPIGIGVTQPRFYWKLQSQLPDQFQTAYQVLVAASPSLLSERRADMWNSGRIDSDQSIHVEYDGRELQSRGRCWWTVRVWDKDGKPSNWSEPAYFEMGLLSPDDWKAKWIKTSIKFDEYSYPSPMLRKEFQLDKKVKSARAYVTSLGLYEMHLNGKKVGDYLFTPGWTSYLKRLQYQVYDLTPMLKVGSNAVGIVLGNGWYRNFRAYGNDAPNQEERERQDLEAFVQIEIEYTDGSWVVIVTDESWKSTTGPILMTSIYHGETYDATKEKVGWSTPGYQDSNWKPVEVVARGRENLVATIGPLVKRIEEIEPVKIMYTPGGDTVLDMGQNMVGWCRLNLNCPKGTTITLRHGEVLDKYGNFYTANLRSAKQTIKYTCKGGGPEVYEPRFTFQGFRYVAVSGYPGELTKDMVTGIVVHSDMEREGYFHCNDSLVNRLYESTLWTGKGNMLEVPTDCPQRDERMGWLSDAILYMPTACYHLFTPGFYSKWLKDIAADQLPSGLVHRTAPAKLPDRQGVPGWHDAAVMVPWELYRHYGDVRILKQQYESMKGWVEYVNERAVNGRYLIYKEKGRFGPGDWLAYHSDRQVDNRNDFPGAYTDKDFLGTAFFFHSTDLLARTAALLGKTDDHHRYRELKEKIRAAFLTEFASAGGRLSPNTQSAYAIALYFDILPEEIKKQAAGRIAENIEDIGHITTGLLGTQKICPVLTGQGYVEDAYKILFREEYPSWLYMIKQGATTMWERWDGLKTDSAFQTVAMNSFNHPPFAAIGEWLYRSVAGIAQSPGDAGFKSIEIKPFPGGKMKHVKASTETLYGKISSEWRIENGKFILKAGIPVNTRAKIYVPSSGKQLKMNGSTLTTFETVQIDGLGYHFLVIETGSGSYELESEFVMD